MFVLRRQGSFLMSHLSMLPYVAMMVKRLQVLMRNTKTGNRTQIFTFILLQKCSWTTRDWKTMLRVNICEDPCGGWKHPFEPKQPWLPVLRFKKESVDRESSLPSRFPSCRRSCVPPFCSSGPLCWVPGGGSTWHPERRRFWAALCSGCGGTGWEPCSRSLGRSALDARKKSGTTPLSFFNGKFSCFWWG